MRIVAYDPRYAFTVWPTGLSSSPSQLLVLAFDDCGEEFDCSAYVVSSDVPLLCRR